jgi:hypothetical protein
MFATQTLRVAATQGHKFVPSNKLNAQSTAYTQANSSRMILFFQANRCSLADREVATLGQWINTWNHPGSEKRLTLGGAYDTSRSNRLRRLSFLTAVIEQLGVPQNHIHPDESWTKFTGVTLEDDAPADVVWLQLSS